MSEVMNVGVMNVGQSPERGGGGEEEGQVWGNSRRLDLLTKR